MSEDWSVKATWMRTVGATDAAWSTDGKLVSLRLGAEPVAVTETQQTTTPTEAERRAREQRRRIAGLASGGPVPRLHDDA